MCAETIKARAKICRFCGFDIHGERQKKVDSITQDPTVESTQDIKMSIDRFREVIDYADEIDDSLVYRILESFSKMTKQFPEKNYRAVAELVKIDSGVEYKMIINDLIREGFPFLRSCPVFEVIDDLIVIRKA